MKGDYCPNPGPGGHRISFAEVNLADVLFSTTPMIAQWEFIACFSVEGRSPIMYHHPREGGGRFTYDPSLTDAFEVYYHQNGQVVKTDGLVSVDAKKGGTYTTASRPSQVPPASVHYRRTTDDRGTSTVEVSVDYTRDNLGNLTPNGIDFTDKDGTSFQATHVVFRYSSEKVARVLDAVIDAPGGSIDLQSITRRK